MQDGGSERTKSIRLAAGAVALAVCLVAIQVPIASGATSVDSLEGSAYGAYASVDLGLLQGTIGAVPSVALPPDGGDVSKTAASVYLTVGLTELVDLDELEVSSTGSGVGGSAGNVQSLAVVNGTEVLGGIIHADEVSATCSADATGTVGSVTLVGASVAGVGPLQASPAPNTGISIPGVGTLVLNKQTKGSDGALTVTGLSLSLLPVLGTGTVNIARAVCGVETSATSTPTTVAPSPSTTEGTSTTEPGPTATTTPGGSTTTTSPGPTTTTSPGAWTTTTAGGSTTTPASDDSTTITAEDSNGANGSALASYVSAGNESGTKADGSKTEGSEPVGPEVPYAKSDRDTTVAGLMIEGWGGPPASGQALASSEATPEASRASDQWPNMADLAILGALIAAMTILIDWRNFDLRRLVGKVPVVNRRR